MGNSKGEKEFYNSTQGIVKEPMEPPLGEESPIVNELLQDRIEVEERMKRFLMKILVIPRVRRKLRKCPSEVKTMKGRKNGRKQSKNAEIEPSAENQQPTTRVCLELKMEEHSRATNWGLIGAID
ncbi:hypothetical protein M9H77_11946 [Catharanthus roseus]|uniref:Uncharacterized protein n=1 Tax=Catharanthus roseus TaxID=4058 RepID=A0ACC0BG37_CATRO|nr:hypothetical protein M9H77_11946 [Catharanthus roseus]